MEPRTKGTSNAFGVPKAKKNQYESALKKMSADAYAGDAWAARSMKGLHSTSPTSPRGALGESIRSQANSQSDYMSPAGGMLYQRRNPGIPITPGDKSLSTRGGGFTVSSKPNNTLEANAGFYAIGNHEAEHNTRQAPTDSMREVGPAIGDLVFMGEQFKLENNKPLDHTVTLPGGKSHDINWMMAQAKQHGY